MGRRGGAGRGGAGDGGGACLLGDGDGLEVDVGNEAVGVGAEGLGAEAAAAVDPVDHDPRVARVEDLRVCVCVCVCVCGWARMLL